MKNIILLAWIGHTDLRAAQGELANEFGPIGQAVRKRGFSHIYLLSNDQTDAEQAYCAWLESLTEARIHLRHFDLAGPTRFDEIYEAARSTLDTLIQEHQDAEIQLTYHMSPGSRSWARSG